MKSRKSKASLSKPINIDPRNMFPATLLSQGMKGILLHILFYTIIFFIFFSISFIFYPNLGISLAESLGIALFISIIVTWHISSIRNEGKKEKKETRPKAKK